VADAGDPVQPVDEGLDPSTRSDILSTRLSEVIRHTLTPGPRAPISFSTPRCRRVSDIFRPRVMRARVYGPRRWYNKGMARKHRSLVEHSLASHHGILVYSTCALRAKVSSGHRVPVWISPEYHIIRKGEPIMFLDIWSGGLSPAGRTCGWARVLHGGVVGYIPPSKIMRLCILPTAP